MEASEPQSESNQHSEPSATFRPNQDDGQRSMVSVESSSMQINTRQPITESERSYLVER